MFDGREPIYLQIAEQIRDQVLRGTLGEEEQVMSTTQYATTFRINPATAQKAFGELVEEGILYKRRGLGMFVAAGARETLRERRRARFFAEVVDQVAAEARVLDIPIDDVVARLRATPSAADPGEGRPTPTSSSPHEATSPHESPSPHKEQS